MALILCPRDRHLLAQSDPARQPCRHCGGVFVLRDAIKGLMDELQETKGGMLTVSPYRSAPGMERGQRPPPAPEEPDLRYLACPHCSKQMNRLTLFQDFRLVVDMCVQHGVWFDAEELKRATDYIRTSKPAVMLDQLENPQELQPEQSVEMLLAYFFSKDRHA